MRIAIDATIAGSKSAERHGIYRYLKQLLIGFRAVGSEHQFRLWFNSFRRSHVDGVEDFLAEVRGPRVRATVSRFPARVRERLGLPVEWFSGPVDLFHSPNHLLPRLWNARAVVTIHDLACLRMTENLTRLNPDWSAAISRRAPHPEADLAAYRARCDFFLGLQRNLRATLARADAILAVSEATARDLVNLTRVPRSKIRVVPNGLTPGLQRVQNAMVLQETLGRLGVARPYLLYVGVLDPNKDLHTLIGAFAGTSAAFRDGHQLVVAGPRNWFQAVLEEEADRLGVGNRVRFLGYVPDAMLSALYSGALAAVSPSPLEGFGLTVLEAMACGTPVVVVNSGALPEVAGEAAVRVPPSDPAAMAAAMERVVGDAGLAADLVDSGFNRCRAFSWERTAKMTLDVYAEVAG